ncbi:MAG: phospholipase D-like domain-containing protein [Sulfuriferula sp.]|nr:phospholipase D-like domain-containing protein [Sulfuriferula sp.]MDP2026526.1 phospholipase D-like domain-containing protein [Sulfuriferula sp.]
MACCVLSLSACASLPNTDQATQQTSPRVSKVVALETQAARSTAGGQSDDIARALMDRHLAVEQGIPLDTPLVAGNRATLLQDGPKTYDAMFAAIRGAHHSINLETYIFEDGEIGQKFADLLLEKQAAGVRVNVIYDSVGSLATPVEFFQRLRDGGVQVVEFNPVNPLAPHAKTWLVNNRDHRKLLIVDGRIAFVGGINISNTYSRGSFIRKTKKKMNNTLGWRDTHVQLDGPVVAEFQKLFMSTWNSQHGPALPQDGYFPVLSKQGSEVVRAIGSTYDAEGSPIYLTLLSAIAQAERQVYLTNAYFVPDPKLVQVLIKAARRGVDVRLILPSQSDSWIVFNAGRSHYTELLKGGVRIFERRGSVLHAKTGCIDGVWSTVGSTNLDWRSFLHNDEINAVILGAHFGTQMDDAFARDLASSDEITLARWERRSPIQRLEEWIARLPQYWL